MTIGRQPFEDVSPTKHGDFPASHVSVFRRVTCCGTVYFFERQQFATGKKGTSLGGVFKYFLFSSLPGELIPTWGSTLNAFRATVLSIGLPAMLHAINSSSREEMMTLVSEFEMEEDDFYREMRRVFGPSRYMMISRMACVRRSQAEEQLATLGELHVTPINGRKPMGFPWGEISPHFFWSHFIPVETDW